MKIRILKSARKHGLSDEDIAHGIANTLQSVFKETSETEQLIRFSIGVLTDGRICEFLSFFEDDMETIVVFHALVPPTDKFLRTFKRRR